MMVDSAAGHNALATAGGRARTFPHNHNRNIDGIVTWRAEDGRTSSGQFAFSSLPRTRPIASNSDNCLELGQLKERIIETFLYCDLFQYELSARGELRGSDARSFVDAIAHLPREAAATLDLREVTGLDAAAARAMCDAVEQRMLDGVEFAVLATSPQVSTQLAAAGLDTILGAP